MIEVRKNRVEEFEKWKFGEGMMIRFVEGWWKKILY